MLSFIDVQSTAIIALLIIGFATVFHVLVVARVVPTHVVWGGQIPDPARAIRMEIVSIVVLVVSAGLIVLRTVSLLRGVPNLAGAIGVWVLVGLFVLNTIGNLFAKTKFEKAVFTPLTFALLLLTLRLALERVAIHG